MVATSASFTEEPLKRLLEQVHEGRIQVPEFQRGFALEDEWIRNLLASVSLGYPIGAVMLLRSGSPDLRFESRPIAGVPTSQIEPEWLLLDGQQRLTALYQVLASGHAALTDDHGKPSARWYSLDMKAALDPNVDRDAAIISFSELRQTGEVDLSSRESEWEGCVFPLRLVGTGDELRRWQRGFVTHEAADDRMVRERLWGRFEEEVLSAFQEYRVPTIRHGRETARWSVRVHGGPQGRSLSDRFRMQ